jgi:phosphatidylinositol-3-phosphatase
MFRTWFRNVSQLRMARTVGRHTFQPTLESLEDRAVPSANPSVGDVFYILMENHNLTQPSSVASPQALLNNPAAPYLNSLITPGNANAAQVSYASNYQNVAPGIHPSEPNYVWSEAGMPGPLNDADPFPSNVLNAPNLSGLLQSYGVTWKSYQEDIDLVPDSGSVNQPGSNSLTSTVADPSDWTVPLTSFSGTSPDYTNTYNGSNQYNFAAKHDGQLFFKATNGGDNLTPSNPEAPYYAPLQQLQTDLGVDTTARYNVITPDQFNDMHSALANGFTYHGTAYTGDQAAIAEGDNFLSIVVPQIMASNAYKNNGTIVIWFDETEGGDTSQFTLPEIVISPLAKGNAYTNNVHLTHSSDLKSMMELFGVSGPGGGFLGNANAPGTNDLSSLFKAGALNSGTLKGVAFLDLAGTGTFKNSDPGVSGLIVTLTGIDSVTEQSVTLTTTTNANGLYTFAGLLPGTYTITITPAGNLQNDYTTPTGSLNDITLGQSQTISNLNFGLLPDTVAPSSYHSSGHSHSVIHRRG